MPVATNPTSDFTPLLSVTWTTVSRVQLQEEGSHGDQARVGGGVLGEGAARAVWAPASHGDHCAWDCGAGLGCAEVSRPRSRDGAGMLRGLSYVG